MKKFDNVDELNLHILKKVSGLHPKDLDLVFLEGGFARGNPSKWSDIDYTACVANKISHPKFLFEFVEINGVKRISSVFFYETSKDILIPRENIEDEHYLWIKDMMLS